jgi:Putative lumazine-binding
MRNRILLLGGFLCLLLPRAAAAQPKPDIEGVRRAALDYIEGFYEGDAAKLRRSVRPEVQKFGFYREGTATTYATEPMSFQEMIEYADRVKARGRGAPEGAPKGVEVLDVQDQTAAARVTAWWGIDYLQLARYDGRWMILHVLWQSPPPKA